MPKSYTKRKGSKQLMPDPSNYLFNIDTLHYTAEIFNYEEVMSNGLRDLLIEGRDVYHECSEGDPLNLLELKVHGYDSPVSFEIRAGAKNVGSYSIRNNDYGIYFRNKDNLVGTFPIKVQINQQKLWELGALGAFLESLQILIALGFDFGQCKPSRIDPCVHSDQWQWDFNDFEKFDYPLDVTKSNHPNFFKLDPRLKKFETAYLGSRNTGLLLRIYNKSKEINVKKKDYFKDIYIKHGLNPHLVWNIEFEISRKFLKGFVNPDTFELDFFDHVENLISDRGLSLLWSFLMDKFNHPSAHWSMISKGDINKFKYVGEKLIRHKDIDASKSREVAQIRGRLHKMILREVVEKGKELPTAINIFRDLLEEYEEETEKDFVADLNRKRIMYVDNQILSLTYDIKSSELTGQIKNIDSKKERLSSFELERDIFNWKRKRERAFRKNKIADVAMIDKIISELEDKQKALVSSRITIGL
ncbi:replication initiation protein [Brevibacillus laterosporus]|uniref:replication initiation protein n=1 Tax=Brevibacillus laterosporus TaxID=1465 RepID=UPI003D1A18D9